MERNDIIKSVPAPTNKDVIVYDLSLTHLLNEENIFENYKNILSSYLIEKDEFILRDQEMKAYKSSIDNIYLYNKSWTEEDYMQMLQNAKRTYSNMYGEIKKQESKLEVLQKKCTTMNEQIEIQMAKDKKEIEDKKKNIDNEIVKIKEKISELQGKKMTTKVEFNSINNAVKDNLEELKLIQDMMKELGEDTYICKYCGTKITNGNSKKRIERLLEKNVANNQAEFNKLKSAAEKIEINMALLDNELKELKNDLKNKLEFKKEDYTFYIKKSLKVLEMEASRNELLNNIETISKSLEKNSQTKEKEFLDLKDKMQKYELSLENLNKIREATNGFSEKYKQLQQLKNEIIEKKNKLIDYVKFIGIYFKIYEQKINDYFGKDFKFKLIQIDGIEAKNVFKVFYKGIEYNQLDKKNKEEFDQIYDEKISYFI